MKIVLSILIWVIIGLVIILGVKTLISKIRELKEKKKAKNNNINKEEQNK